MSVVKICKYFVFCTLKNANGPNVTVKMALKRNRNEQVKCWVLPYKHVASGSCTLSKYTRSTYIRLLSKDYMMSSRFLCVIVDEGEAQKNYNAYDHAGYTHTITHTITHSISHTITHTNTQTYFLGACWIKTLTKKTR